MGTGIKLLILAAGAVWLGILVIPDNKLHVVFCDVGQGDATLISYKNTQLLVDGGPGQKIFGCLEEHMPFWDRTIEMAVVTHKQSDHEFGITEAAKRYRILHYEPVLRKGEVVSFEKFEFKILWPDDRILGADTLGKENNEGIVGIVIYKDFDVLLTADVDTENYRNISGVEVVKVPHHGSKYQWDESWYSIVKPALTVISVGKNSYGHPAPEMITGLKELGIKYLRTDEVGDVEIVSNGNTWFVK